MKFLCEGVQKLKPEQIYTQIDRQSHTDRQTHRQTDRQTQTDRHTAMTENITYPVMWVVKKKKRI